MMGAREVFPSCDGWLMVSASRTTSCNVRANSKIRSISLWTSAEGRHRGLGLFFSEQEIISYQSSGGFIMIVACVTLVCFALCLSVAHFLFSFFATWLKSPYFHSLLKICTLFFTFSLGDNPATQVQLSHFFVSITNNYIYVYGSLWPRGLSLILSLFIFHTEQSTGVVSPFILTTAINSKLDK